MPGNDTIYYDANGREIPYDSVPAEMKALLKELPATDTSNKEQTPEVYIIALGLVLFISFIIVMVIKIVDRPGKPSAEVVPTVEDNNTTAAAEGQGPREYFVYEGSNLGLNEDEITAIIVKYYPVYNQLWPTVQYRFQQRLFDFIRHKSFIIYSQEPYKEMPVITSAAAIHLTLGLEEYMLPWFKYICIHPEEYFANDALRVLAGNVEGNTITFAWNQVLKGIKDGTDGCNVGLHEWAHALYYQQAIVENNKAKNFSEHFDKVMQEGEEVYRLKNTQHVLYTDYAYRNLQEFWAESIEIFFEKPADMQRCYPEIYETIKELLKQDPANKENPLC